MIPLVYVVQIQEIRCLCLKGSTGAEIHGEQSLEIWDTYLIANSLEQVRKNRFSAYQDSNWLNITWLSH